MGRPDENSRTPGRCGRLLQGHHLREGHQRLPCLPEANSRRGAASPSLAARPGVTLHGLCHLPLNKERLEVACALWTLPLYSTVTVSRMAPWAPEMGLEVAPDSASQDANKTTARDNHPSITHTHWTVTQWLKTALLPQEMTAELIKRDQSHGDEGSSHPGGWGSGPTQNNPEKVRGGCVVGQWPPEAEGQPWKWPGLGVCPWPASACSPVPGPPTHLSLSP